MVGSADMTNKRALESTMSMSLFKSPEYAQEVWTWLDKHGNTPLLRENFKHLVSICTVKPVKVASVQPLQRKSSDTHALDAARTRTQTQEYGHNLKHQSSTRFVPAASVAGRPAAPVRPASAASARRKHAVGDRPATAAAGTLRSFNPSDMTPLLTGSTVLPATGPAVIKQAELVRPPSRSRPPLPSSDGFLLRRAKKAAAPDTTCASPGGNRLGSVTLSAVQTSDLPAAAEAEAVSKPASVGADCSSSAAVHGFKAAVASASGCMSYASHTAFTAPQVNSSEVAETASAAGQIAESVAGLSASHQQHPCRTQAALQPFRRVAAPKSSAEKQGSRPSTSGSSKQLGATPFDRRLALLHKGLPTHMPCSVPSRPPTRGLRPATQQTQMTAAAGSLHGSMLPSTSTISTELPAMAFVPQQVDRTLLKQVEATSSEEQSCGALADSGSSIAAVAQQAAAGAALGKEQNLSKPSSPTSVLPGSSLSDTTYHSFFGLADAYPELYLAAAAAGKAHKANSRALQSVVGETLKGNPELWKQQLKSAYTMCNDRLKQDAGWGAMDGIYDGPFLEWVGRSQLYSGDLLAPEAAQELANWMDTAPAGDKREMMALFRDLHANISPTGPHLQSVSHSTHTRQVPFVGTKEAERDLQSGTRPGISAPVMREEQPSVLADDKAIALQVPSAAATQQESAAATQVHSTPKPRGVNVNAVTSKGTFRSSINLSQGAPATVRSTYGDTHGASMPQLMAAVQTVAQQHAEAQKPVQVTCPFGTLDPLMDRAHLVAFPVPSGLLQGTTELHTDAQRNGLDATHYGQSFCSDAFKGNAAVLLAAAQREKEMSKAAGSRTTIPLGKKAVNCVPLYNTTYHDEFKAHALDVSQQRASAEHLRSLYHSPTATVGCITRSQ